MITRVQNARGTSSSNPLTVTLDDPPTEWNLIVAAIALRGDEVTYTPPPPTVASISQTGVTWTKMPPGFNQWDGVLEVWVGAVGADANAEITINMSGDPTGTCIVDLWEYSGLPYKGYLDKYGTGGGNGTNPTTPWIDLTSQDNELWVGIIFATNIGSGAQTDPQNGFTLIDGAREGNKSLAYLDNIVSSKGNANSGTTMPWGHYDAITITFNGDYGALADDLSSSFNVNNPFYVQASIVNSVPVPMSAYAIGQNADYIGLGGYGNDGPIVCLVEKSSFSVVWQQLCMGRSPARIWFAGGYMYYDDEDNNSPYNTFLMRVRLSDFYVDSLDLGTNEYVNDTAFDGSSIYMSFNDGIAKIDLASFTVTGGIDLSSFVSSSGFTIYSDGYIYTTVIDNENNTILLKLPASLDSYEQITLDVRIRRCWTGCADDTYIFSTNGDWVQPNYISVVDKAAFTEIAVIEVQSVNMDDYGSLLVSNGTLYLSDWYNDHADLQLVDVASLLQKEVGGAIALPPEYYGAEAITISDGFLYLPVDNRVLLKLQLSQSGSADLSECFIVPTGSVELSTAFFVHEHGAADLSTSVYVHWFDGLNDLSCSVSLPEQSSTDIQSSFTVRSESSTDLSSSFELPSYASKNCGSNFTVRCDSETVYGVHKPELSSSFFVRWRFADMSSDFTLPPQYSIDGVSTAFIMPHYSGTAIIPVFSTKINNIGGWAVDPFTAQPFTPTSNLKVYGVGFYLQAYGGQAGISNRKFSIRAADINHEPTGPDLASVIVAPYVSDSGQDIYVGYFASPYTLTAGVEYVAVDRYLSGKNLTHQICSLPEGTNTWSSSYDGGTWSQPGPTYDVSVTLFGIANPDLSSSFSACAVNDLPSNFTVGPHGAATLSCSFIVPGCSWSTIVPCAIYSQSKYISNSNTNPGWWLATIFNAPWTKQILGITFKIVNFSNSGQTVYVALQNAAAGRPTGADLAVSPAISAPNNNPDAITYYFNTPYTLLSGHSYGFSLRPSAGYMFFGMNTGGGMGVAASYDQGATWGGVFTGWDLLYDILGLGVRHPDLSSSFFIPITIANLASSFRIRKNASKNLSASVTLTIAIISKNISSSFAIRRSASKNVSSSFKIRKSNSKNISCKFIVTHQSNVNLSSSFHLSLGTAANLSASFTIKKSTAKDLSGSFTCRKTTVNDLSSSFELRESVAVNLRSNFSIRDYSSKTLRSSFTLRKASSKDLSCNVTVRLSSSKDLSCKFGVSRYANLSESFNLRILTVDLSSSMNLRILTKDLSEKFSVRNKSTKDLRCSFTVRTRSSKDLSSSWTIRKSSSSDLPALPYYQTHVIQHTTGAGANYQIKINLHSGVGASTTSDLYLNNHCINFPWDLYVTASDGVTPLSYWINDTANPKELWVNVVADLTSIDRTIYIYYGIPNFTSLSNGPATFLAFESFDSSLAGDAWPATLDTNDGTAVGSYYDVTVGVTPAETGGGRSGVGDLKALRPYVGQSSIYVAGVSELHYGSNFFNAQTIAVDFDYYLQTLGTPVGWWDIYAFVAFKYGSSYYLVRVKDQYQGGYQYRFNQFLTGAVFPQGPNSTTVLTGDALQTWYSKSINSITYAGANAISDVYVGVAGGSDSNTGYGSIEAYFDNLRVRKYVSPEPQNITWSAESGTGFPGTLTISGSFTIRKTTSKNLSSSFSIRRSASKTGTSEAFYVHLHSAADFSEAFYVHLHGNAFLSHAFLCRNRSSKNMPTSITIQGAGTGDVRCNFTIRNFADLSESFTVHNTPGKTNLSSKFVISKPGFRQLRSKFTLRKAGSKSGVSSSFSIRLPNTANAHGSVTIRTSRSKDCRSNIRIRNRGSRALSSSFSVIKNNLSSSCTVRKASSKRLSSSIYVNKQSFSRDLLGRFTVRSRSTADLSGSFTPKHISANCRSSFTVRSKNTSEVSSSVTLTRRTKNSLSSSFTVRSGSSAYNRGKFKIGHSAAADVSSKFTLRKATAADASANITVRQSTSRTSKCSFTVRSRSTRALSSNFYLKPQRNLSSNFTLRKSNSKTLRSSFYVRKLGFSDLSSKFIIKKRGSQALSSSVSPQRISANCRCSFTVRQASTKDMHGNFTLTRRSYKRLSSNFTVQNKATTTLRSSFRISNPFTVDLSSSFSLRKALSQDTSCSITLRHQTSKDCRSSFRVRSRSTRALSSNFYLKPQRNLSSNFTLRKSTAKDLRSSVYVRKLGSASVSCKFTIRSRGSLYLSSSITPKRLSTNCRCSVTVRNKGSAALSSSFYLKLQRDLSSSFTNRRSTSKDLRSSVYVRKLGQAEASGKFTVRKRSGVDLSCSVTPKRLSANCRCSFTVRQFSSKAISSSFTLTRRSYKRLSSNVTVRNKAAAACRSSFRIGHQSTVFVSSSFSIRSRVSAAVSSNFTVRSVAVKNSKCSFTIRGRSTRALSCSFYVPPQRNLSSSFQTRKVSSRRLSSSFYVRRIGAADVSAKLVIRKRSSRDCSGSFTPQRLHANYRCTFTVRNRSAKDLGSSFTIGYIAKANLRSSLTLRISGSVSLRSSFRITHSTSTEVSSSFTVRRPAAANLHSNVTIKKSGLKDFKCSFTVRHQIAKDLRSSFNLKKPTAVDLSSSFFVLVAPSLPSNVTIRKVSKKDLRSSVSLRKRTEADCSCSFIVYRPRVDLSCSFTIRRSSRQRLRSNFTVRGQNARNLSSSVCVVKSDNLRSNFSIGPGKFGYVHLATHSVVRTSFCVTTRAKVSTWLEENQ